MTDQLTQDQIQQYKNEGYVIVRDLYSQNELDQVAEAVLRGVKRTDIETRKKLYPEPATQFILDSRYIEDPGLTYIATHPFVVEAAQTLLGGPVALSASVAYLKTPGAKGTGGDYGGSHPTAHQDYKTYQQAGSSINWLFAITPLVDLTEEIGPLALSPASFKISRKTRQGRVYKVQRSSADQIAPMHPAQLKRGDLLLMNMFTWHEAGPNQSPRDRYGIYNKYRALNAPPACGPELFSDKAHQQVTYNGRSLLPHHGDCGLGNVRLLLEHNEQFLLARGPNGWHLPGGPINPDQPIPHANLVGRAQEIAHQQLGADLPWASYIGDFAEQEQLSRIYAYPFEEAPELEISNGMEVEWMSIEQMRTATAQSEFAGDYEAEAAELWLSPNYEHGIGEAGRIAAKQSVQNAK